MSPLLFPPLPEKYFWSPTAKLTIVSPSAKKLPTPVVAIVIIYSGRETLSECGALLNEPATSRWLCCGTVGGPLRKFISFRPAMSNRNASLGQKLSRSLEGRTFNDVVFSKLKFNSGSNPVSKDNDSWHRL